MSPKKQITRFETKSIIWTKQEFQKCFNHIYYKNKGECTYPRSAGRWCITVTQCVTLPMEIILQWLLIYYFSFIPVTSILHRQWQAIKPMHFHIQSVSCKDNAKIKKERPTRESRIWISKKIIIHLPYINILETQPNFGREIYIYIGRI